ncbi:hypothetical protein GpartN1_g6563.t1 [Galdieria partita]|uniref:Uncharacterized protein n=1 Tax=Galdieria partita TaxID=83374 RepID=A0A9C7Q3W8_9RHOD|nr:hypothetical protein GpartN1_g6563.t1 [Galdieria partita]
MLLFCVLAVTFLQAVYANNASCSDAVPSCNTSIDYFVYKLSFPYLSDYVSVDYENISVRLNISIPDQQNFSYTLVRCGCEHLLNSTGNETVIPVPPRSLGGISTTEIPFIQQLGGLHLLKVFYEGQYAYNEQLLMRLKTNLTYNAQHFADFINTSVVPSPPNVTFVDTYSVSEFANRTENKLKYFVTPGILVKNAMARAELYKLYGLILDVPELADELSQSIIQSYMDTKEMVASHAKKWPSVLIDGYFDGVWSLDSGVSYEASFLRDAHAAYRYANSSNSPSLSLDQVVDNFRGADFWINLDLASPVYSLSELLQTYKQQNESNVASTVQKLAAFQCGQVWSNAKRYRGESNDYYELGSARPDWILKDLVKIFHPELETNHSFVFYYQLANNGSSTLSLHCPYHNLSTSPPSGRQFVILHVSVNSSMFPIQNALNLSIFPMIASLYGISYDDMQVYFLNPGEDSSSNTLMYIKLSVPSNNVSNALSTSHFHFAGALETILKDNNVSTSVTSMDVTTTAPVSTSSGLSGGDIAGIVVGSVVGFCLVVGVVIFAYWYGHRRAYKRIEGSTVILGASN